MSDKYILAGKKTILCDNLIEWAKKFGKTNRVVAQSRIKKVRVSTVFLGLDHSWGENKRPLLFETMIFGGVHDQYQERYSTWEEAEDGHKKAVELIKQ